MRNLGLYLGALTAALIAVAAPRVSAADLSGSAAASAPAQASEARSLEDLRQELRRRNQALVQQGFNLTQGMGLKGKGGEALRLSLILPPYESERRLQLWMATLGGEARFTLRGPGAEGPVRLTWAAQQGEVALPQDLPSGRYALEFDATASDGGVALLGVKGPAQIPPKLDPARTQEFAADAARGFHWPYFLYTPKLIKAPHLLVVPNNSGFVSEDLELLRGAAATELNQQIVLAENLGVALLVPMFPRPADASANSGENLYLHALSRATLLNTQPAWQRVDRQLLAMIDEARRTLAQRGQVTAPEVLMSGFSASGSFVNRFAFLHPERVLALASGSPGGWPLAPVTKFKGQHLNYPVGLNDWAKVSGEPLRLKALKSVAALIYMGDQDENDAVIYRDSFSSADERLIFKNFGSTPLARWQGIRQLYAAQGLNAKFVLYPGAAHSVTPEMRADIEAFFKQRLAAATPPR
ncbi:hypothetical protein WG899_00565 [Paucibacter sp. AS339]|uniref:hypothetical protein n=1 Tax=Paucibacter hankyongi TaxID=3133434 RepID=UPI0030A157F1